MDSFIKKIGVILITTLVYLSSCQSSLDEPDIDYVKIIQTPEYKVSWCYENLLTSKTLDYIEISNNDSTVVICKSDKIVDINIFEKDSLVIKFCGKPRQYGNPISIPEEVLNLKIRVDRTGKCTPDYRPSFKLR